MSIACTLSPERASDQLEQWEVLRRTSTSTTVIDGSVRLTFTAVSAPEVTGLARREQSCRAFVRLVVDTDADACRLDVTSEHVEAPPVISLLVGVPLDRLNR